LPKGREKKRRWKGSTAAKLFLRLRQRKEGPSIFTEDENSFVSKEGRGKGEGEEEGGTSFQV